MHPLADDAISLASARRASRTVAPEDPVGRLIQAWTELHAQRCDHGEQDVGFDLAWRKHPLLKNTSDRMELCFRNGPDQGPDGPALTRLLQGLGPRDWPQGRDALAVLWNTTVMTWRSANVPPLTDAQRRTIVDAFLSAGLNPNAGGTGMQAPLYLAVSQRDLPLVKHLVAHGGDVHRFHRRQALSSPDPVSIGLLTLAAQRNDPAMCAWLLEQGVPLVVPHATMPQPMGTAVEHHAWDAFRVLEQAALRSGLPVPDIVPDDSTASAVRGRRRL